MEQVTDAIPKWFWKIAAICTVGGTITLVTVGWSLGSFMSETQTWQRAQDERFFSHLEAEKNLHEQLIGSVTTVKDTVTANGEYGAQFRARMDVIDHRLTSLENKE